MHRLSVVIPAFNEEEHIEDVVENLVEHRAKIIEEAKLASLEILVVNDGSTDRTGPKLEELKSKYPDLVVLTHHGNRGYGAALKTGFDRASGEFLSFMDADGTIDPKSFVMMYSESIRSDAQMVVGTRFGEGGSGMPLVRRLGNIFFAGLLSFLSGERVKDSASGVRLFRREILDILYPLPDGLHFTPAMSAKAVHEKIKIAEVPVPYAERQGDSKLHVLKDGIRFFKIIVGTVLLYNPFKVFFLFGLVFLLVSSALLSVPLVQWLFGEVSRFSDYIYRSIGALYFATAGVQIILFGILARFIVSTFFKAHESGVLIHRINDKLKVYDRMGYYGLGVFALGGLINAGYFANYLFTGGLGLHWFLLLFAAGFIIVGLQMMITGVVMRILMDIKEAKGL